VRTLERADNSNSTPYIAAVRTMVVALRLTVARLLALNVFALAFALTALSDAHAANPARVNPVETFVQDEIHHRFLTPPSWRAISASSFTSHPRPVPGSTPWRVTLQNCPSNACSEASSAPSQSFKPPSKASSRKQNGRQNPSSGPQTRVKSSPPSSAGTKC
jgi:hypothetical protein